MPAVLTVAVTGATGFIGQHLVPALLAAGYKVKALTRRSQKPDTEVDWIQGDLSQFEALSQLVQGAHYVVHLAGQVRGSNYSEFETVNVAGCQNIIKAASQSSLNPGFLMISSLAARHPELSHYAASKHAGEALLSEKNSALDWTIFRPTAVYGTGDLELMPLFNSIARGWIPRINHNGRISLIYVADLVHAIMAWLVHPQKPFGNIYELSDGRREAYTLDEIVATILGLKRPTRIPLPLPKSLLLTIAWLNNCLSLIFGYTPMLTPGKVREIWHPDWRCRYQEGTDFGWTPRYQLEDALKAIWGPA